MFAFRFALNVKGIPYRTEWISYPDISRTFQDIGFKPTGATADGTPLYTCPAITDPNTVAPVLVAESTDIALYLDSTYSHVTRHGPRLFPEGTQQAQLDVVKRIGSGFANSLVNLLLPSVPSVLEDPRGADYFVRTRHERRGFPLSELCPAGSEARAAAWEALRKDLAEIASVYDQNGEGDGEYFSGCSITYVDIVMAALLLWTRLVPSGRDGDSTPFIWQEIAKLNGGRWARLLAKFEKYEQIL